MQIVGDESVDYPVLHAIQHLGHDVYAVAFEAPGSSDINMSGLIWEWTSTPWEQGSPFMTKKGGCSINFAPLMQSSARFEDLPELILQWVGFRACAGRLP